MVTPTQPVAQRSALFEALRSATREEHTQIEDLLRLTEPMSEARYTAILAGFHHFLSHWEPRLSAALPERLVAWSRARQRSGFAAADLRHFGIDPNAIGSPLQLPAPVRALALDPLPRALGSMYVIEGSALGGQVITPKLSAQLGVAPDAGARYFHGFGSATGAMWREFRERVDAEVGASATAVQAACESARATFKALIGVFNDRLAT